MENTRTGKLSYYDLEYENGLLFKGESNADNTNYGLYLIKDLKNNKIWIGTPFEIKIYQFNLSFCFDFNKGLVTFGTEPNKNNLLTEKNILQIKWKFLNNSNNQQDFLEKLKIRSFDFFDAFKPTKIQFNDIKDSIKYEFKKMVYSKLNEIDTILNETINMNLILEISTQYKNEFLELKKSHECFYDNKINKELQNKGYQYYEKIEQSTTNKIDLITSKYIKLFEERFKLIYDLINKEYFSTDNLNNAESFDYRDIENDNLDFNSYLLIKTFNNVQLKNSKVYLSYTKSSGVLQINTSEIGPNKVTFTLDYSFSKKAFFISINGKFFLKRSITNNETVIYNMYEYKARFKILKHLSHKSIEFNPNPNPNTNTNTHISNKQYNFNYYIGESENDLFTKGMLDTEDYFYIGEFKDNQKSGNCEIYFKKEKEYYQGKVENNVLKGEGKYFFNIDSDSNNSIITSYSGIIKENKAQGNGTIEFTNGSYYTGEFNQNLKNGTGRFTNSKGDYVKIKNNFDTNTQTYEYYY